MIRIAQNKVNGLSTTENEVISCHRNTQVHLHYRPQGSVYEDKPTIPSPTKMSLSKNLLMSACWFSENKEDTIEDQLKAVMEDYGQVDKVQIVRQKTVAGGNTSSESTWPTTEIFIILALIAFQDSQSAQIAWNSMWNYSVNSKFKVVKLWFPNSKVSFATELNGQSRKTMAKMESLMGSALSRYKANNFSQAAAKLKEAMDLHEAEELFINTTQVTEITLTYCRSMTLLLSGCLEHVKEGYELMRLQNLKHTDTWITKEFPAMHLGMTRYELALNRPVSTKLATVIESLNFNSQWPLMHLFKDFFPEANPNKLLLALENLDQTTKHPQKPEATCRFAQCQELHDKSEWAELILWRPFIHADNIDYKGYYRVICRDNCNVDFHPICWKNRKMCDKVHVDKEYLHWQCFTPDCPAMVSKIAIYKEGIEDPVVITDSAPSTPERYGPPVFLTTSNTDTENIIVIDDRDKEIDSLRRQLKRAKNIEVEQQLTIDQLNTDKDNLTDLLTQSRSQEANTMGQMLSDYAGEVNKVQHLQVNVKSLINQSQHYASENKRLQVKKDHDMVEVFDSQCKIIFNLCKFIMASFVPESTVIAKFTQSLQKTIDEAKFTLTKNKEIKMMVFGNINYSHDDLDYLALLNEIKKKPDNAARAAVPPGKNNNRNGVLGDIVKILLAIYVNQTSDELFEHVLTVKQMNGNSLRTLTINQVIDQVSTLIFGPIDIINECCICLDPLSKNGPLTRKIQPCNHEFHDECIKKIFDDTGPKTGRTCPLCREHILLEEEYPRLTSVVSKKRRHC